MNESSVHRPNRYSCGMRRWKLGMWICAVAAAMCATAEVASGWWWTTWIWSSGYGIGCSYGKVALFYFAPELGVTLGGSLSGPGIENLSRTDTSPMWEWWFQFDKTRRWWRVQVPLWAPAALLALVSVLCAARARRLRRARAGQACASCGHLRESSSAALRCPECGRSYRSS